MLKEEKKLSVHFWEINLLSEKLTRTTTDEAALEKLRCHSAGGANKHPYKQKQHKLLIT